MTMKRVRHTKQGYLKALPFQELVKSYVVSNCLKTRTLRAPQISDGKAFHREIQRYVKKIMCLTQSSERPSNFISMTSSC